MTEEQLRIKVAELCLEGVNTLGTEVTYGIACMIQRYAGNLLDEEFDMMRKAYLAEGK